MTLMTTSRGLSRFYSQYLQEVDLDKSSYIIYRKISVDYRSTKLDWPAYMALAVPILFTSIYYDMSKIATNVHRRGLWNERL